MSSKNGLGFLSWVIAAVLVIAVFILIEKPASVSAQDTTNIIRAFQQKRFSFDIQNGSLRFSHGNHRRRDRWFRAYFGTGYSDCSNCHHLEFPEPENGTAVDFVAEIRKHDKDTIPYGIQEETCLSCHNNITAPNDCQWCHVPGSPPLQGTETARLGEYQEPVDPILPDYNENFQRDVDTIRDYKEKRWFFDIQNNTIRFSHGNHSSRDRWFKAYFGTGYRECGNCHNLGLPYASEVGMQLEDGEHLNSVEDIRDYEDDIYPFGIMMARCFETCHNGRTAPNDCMNCHLPGSRALSEGAAGLSDEMQTIVAQSEAGTAGDLQDPGEQVYKQRNCNLCHVLNQVGAPIASDLSNIANRRDLKWLGEFLKNHQEPEPKSTTPRLEFSDEEAQSLAEYLAAER
ncbi:MAG: cytochrome c [Acidobacteria bacterium]|nr:cytochrome c [Acidobacteriota bacterium]